MDLSLLPLKTVWHDARTRIPRDRAPIMVVLHGRGDSPEGFEFLPEALAVPEMNYLMLQAPDDYFDGFSWYDLEPNQLPGVLRSRKLLCEVFTQLNRMGFARERTFLFGFSQGCLMTLEFGGRYPHQLAGYIGVSGYVLDPELLIKEADPGARSGSWLVTHGTLDDVLPASRTRQQIERIQKSGWKIEYLEYRKSHTIDDAQEIPMIREWVRARLKP